MSKDISLHWSGTSSTDFRPNMIWWGLYAGSDNSKRINQRCASGVNLKEAQERQTATDNQAVDQARPQRRLDYRDKLIGQFRMDGGLVTQVVTPGKEALIDDQYLDCAAHD